MADLAVAGDTADLAAAVDLADVVDGGAPTDGAMAFVPAPHASWPVLTSTRAARCSRTRI